MGFPSPQTGYITPSANFRTFTSTSGTQTVAVGGAVQANPNDFIEVVSTNYAATVFLPPVALGAQVIVKAKAYTDTISILADTADSPVPTIDGIAGGTGVALAARYDAAWFISDGTNWHVLDLGTTAA